MRLRSLLFVPGDSERKFARARDCGADALILDLEDAVAPSQKAAMYDAIAAIDWSRLNREWADEAKLGLWDRPKGSDIEQLVILGAGRNNTQAIIDFVRNRTGLQVMLDALKTQESPAPVLV